MTTREFLILSKCSYDDPNLESLPKPFKVGKKKTPSTLNDLTMGELVMLQSITTEHEFLFMPCRVLLDLEEDRVLKLPAFEVIGFSVWVAKEVQRINKLFASTSVPPTSKEIQAGAETLNFGPFGLIDYYALRMGIHSHKEVESVPWVIVYKCLDMDSKRMKYERRLRTIMSEK